jgi:hypothetical protein
MKKHTRTQIANPETRKRRALKLSRETVKVLSSADLARAAGGSNCNTTSFTTEHTDGSGVVIIRK